MIWLARSILTSVGWINCYSRFYKSALYDSLRRIDFHLRKWVRRKFKRFKQTPKGAREWPARIIRTNPGLFAHWPLLHAQQPDTGSRMNREVHVRFQESAAVKLRRATRPRGAYPHRPARPE
jgi:hypothetical protein